MLLDVVKRFVIPVTARVSHLRTSASGSQKHPDVKLPSLVDQTTCGPGDSRPLVILKSILWQRPVLIINT